MRPRQLRYWVKTMVWEGTTSWIMLCDHIGQAKVFGYIYATFNRTTGEWHNTAEAKTAIEQLIGVKRATQYNYLKGLVKVGLLTSCGRGRYKINAEYIAYGNEKKGG